MNSALFLEEIKAFADAFKKRKTEACIYFGIRNSKNDLRIYPNGWFTEKRKWPTLSCLRCGNGLSRKGSLL